MNDFTFWIGTLIGGVVGLILSIVLEDPLKKFYTKVVRRAYRIISIIRSDNFSLGGEYFRVGKWRLNSLILQGAVKYPYRSGQIICQLEDNPLILPDDLQEIKIQIEKEQKDIEKINGLPKFFNGPMVSFLDYSFSSTVGTEEPLLFLRFKPTDYYTYLATAMSLGKTINDQRGTITVRDKYLHSVDLSKPVPFMANSFCVDLCLVTKDNFILISKRSEKALNYTSHFSVAIMETVNPQKDKNATGEIDVFSTAKRGLWEEVGIQATDNEVILFSLHLDTDLYIYGLTGAIISDQYTRSDIMARRSMGLKDKWELNEMYFVEFEPMKVTKAIRELGGIYRFNPSSIVSITQTLVHEHGYSAVERAFNKLPDM